MKKLVIINPRSRIASDPRQLESLLSALREIPETDAHLLQEREDPVAIAREMAEAGAEVVGAAGGDGTLNAVATALAGTDTAMAPMPFGTMNHFCRNIGVPSEPELFTRLLLRSESLEERVDLGRVNGRYFLNNSAMGLYPRLVRIRESRQERIGKWPAMALAIWEVLRRPSTLRVQLRSASGTIDSRAGLLLISNNRITLPLPGYGHRARLDEGMLDVYLVKAAHITALLKVAVAFVRDALAESPLAEHVMSDTAEVHPRGHKLHAVALDGELVWLKSPLKHDIARRALRVRYPIEPAK